MLSLCFTNSCRNALHSHMDKVAQVLAVAHSNGPVVLYSPHTLEVLFEAQMGPLWSPTRALGIFGTENGNILVIDEVAGVWVLSQNAEDRHWHLRETVSHLQRGFPQS